MNHYDIPQINNGICEAVNCLTQAEVQIKVKVGQQGTILLSLCKNCVSKFEEVSRVD
jgi:hypothetical protein